MRPRSNHARVGRLAALIAAILVVAAACMEPGQDARSAAPTGSLTPAVSASASSGGPTAYVVDTASGSVGAYLTGQDGRTLYTFKPDSANTSTCTDSCAESWPPFVVTATDTLKAGPSVTGTLTTFARPDGAMQVAYNGAPLYYFTSDTKAGDTNGQGVGGNWFVAAP